MSKVQVHLEMIQNIINRLSRNSFLLKGWSVILVSSFFALAAVNSKVYFVLLAYFPLVIFWILDAYFLWQERLFRALYDYVRGLKEEEIDFSMKTSDVENQVKPWVDVVFSMTLLLFHGTIFISILIVMIIMIVNG